MSNTTAMGLRGGRVLVREQRGPGFDEFLAKWGIVAMEQGSNERRAVGQNHAVEGQPEQLGEAGLARAVEARDPARGQLGTAVLIELGGNPAQQAHELFMNAARAGAGVEAARTRIALGVAAGDDVLADLGLDLFRALFVKVHDRRNVPGDVGGEELMNLHSWPWA
jgi:hypothetical protein